MSFLLKQRIHNTLVDSIYNDIFTRRSNYYYFIGRVLEWDDPDLPLTPADTGQYEYETRNSIISVKKINFTDISFVINRRNWSDGTIYDQFDPDYSANNIAYSGATRIENALFYVITTEFNVYKCINNNSNRPSTIQPTGTDSTTISLADGYTWKFMYTVPLALRTKFLTGTYMPVQKAVYAPFYTNGEIDQVVVDNGGAGYSGNASVTLRVNGTFKGGTGNSIANVVPVFNSNGQFVSIVIRDRGNNYSSANISIIDNVGSGKGYYNVLSTANLVPVLLNTQVDRVVINDPGFSYASNIQTALILTGDGANAVLTPFVNSAGEIESVIIENRGEGYNYLDIEVAGSGTGANIFPIISSGDLDSTQATVELSAIDGGIHCIKIDNAGDGYSNANITITGDGVGFIGTVNISNSNTVANVTVVNPGTGYTFANVTITGSGANARATAIISPPGGHGYNAVKELYSDTLMLYSTINNEENQNVSVNNDYRQFGIIRNLEQYSSERKFANALGSSCFLVTLQSISGINSDDILFLNDSGRREFEVVEVIPATNQVLITNLNNYPISSNTIFTSNVTGANRQVIAVNASPTINKFSGDCIFIDNRTQVSYSDQQLVTIRTVLKL